MGRGSCPTPKPPQSPPTTPKPAPPSVPNPQICPSRDPQTPIPPPPSLSTPTVSPMCPPGPWSAPPNPTSAASKCPLTGPQPPAPDLSSTPKSAPLDLPFPSPPAPPPKRPQPQLRPFPGTSVYVTSGSLPGPHPALRGHRLAGTHAHAVCCALIGRESAAPADWHCAPSIKPTTANGNRYLEQEVCGRTQKRGRRWLPVLPVPVPVRSRFDPGAGSDLSDRGADPGADPGIDPG